MITNDAMEVHFGLRLLEKVADHTYCHNYPRVNQARELQHLQCLSSNIREADEARLCGSSLPIGPIALPTLGRSRPGLKNHTRLSVQRANHYAMGVVLALWLTNVKT